MILSVQEDAFFAAESQWEDTQPINFEATSSTKHHSESAWMGAQFQRPLPELDWGL